MPAFLTGIQATATLNGIELPFSGWTINPTTEIMRFANSKTGNKRAKAGTYVEATGSLTYDVDVTNQPFAAPLSLIPGIVVANLKLMLDGLAGSNFWLLSSVIIVSLPQRFMREGGKPANSINWENNAGLITPPAGTQY